MIISNLDTTKVAIIGPGRLGTSFAYKLGRDKKRVTIYYHDSEVCKEINRDHLNPLHLTKDLANRLVGGWKIFRIYRQKFMPQMTWNMSSKIMISLF